MTETEPTEMALCVPVEPLAATCVAPNESFSEAPFNRPATVICRYRTRSDASTTVAPAELSSKLTEAPPALVTVRLRVPVSEGAKSTTGAVASALMKSSLEVGSETELPAVSVTVAVTT